MDEADAEVSIEYKGPRLRVRTAVFLLATVLSAGVLLLFGIPLKWTLVSAPIIALAAAFAGVDEHFLRQWMEEKAKKDVEHEP